MGSYRRFAAVIGTALVMGVLPSSAGAAKPPTSGTWTYTDASPNPTVFGECMGPEVPSAPGDVNSYEIKVTKKIMMFETTSHNMLDWAAEIRDSKGGLITSMDSPTPTEQEHLSIALPKGTYFVNYCNWAGEPEITVDWSLTKP